MESAPAAALAIPSLAWATCEDGFECATAHVPLDYRRPVGRHDPSRGDPAAGRGPGSPRGDPVPSAWRAGRLRSLLSSAAVMRSYRWNCVNGSMSSDSTFEGWG